MTRTAADPYNPAMGFAFGDWDGLRANFIDAAGRSPFVREQLERSGLSATDAVRDHDAWRRLRPIEKQDLIADQERAPPFGERRCVPEPEISLVVESSGSTGMGQEVHYLSRADLERSTAQWAAYLRGMGVGADDVVALTFPIGMAGGGVRHWYAYVEAGARVLRMGGLSSERKLEAIRYYRATTLVATPAYVDRLGPLCAEAGIEPSELALRRIVVATQSLTTDWIRETERLWGARLYEWYGTSAGVAAFCCERGMVDADGRRGTLHWNPAVAVQEVVDPATGAHVSDGDRGEMIATPLINTAEPVFRIKTGDQVAFRAPGACPCGSPWPGIESGTVRRLDAMFKIKGINVWPAHVEAVLELPDVLDYRVRIWQDDAKRERVRLELLARPGVGDGLDAHVAALLRRETGISFEVASRPDRSDWSQATGGEAGKARRWVDERIGVAG
jgi:phenylacetate-CoA ligase